LENAGRLELLRHGHAGIIAGMNNRLMQKRFPNPEDTSGLPVARSRRPIPRRETPLAGTRATLHPKEGDLRSLVTGAGLHEPPPSRSSKVIGWLALAMAVLVPAMTLLPSALWDHLPWVFILGLAAVHLLGIFSQIYSSGRNLPGAVAIPVAWLMFGVVAVIDWLMA
jgi:hypothetical protein